MRISGRPYVIRGAVAVVLVALVVVVGLVPAPVEQAQASTFSAQLAPVDAEFSSFLNSGPTIMRTVDGRPLGAIPSPLNSALTRGMQVEGASAAATLPSSFDLRTYGEVTPVRDQSSFGTCWAFATYGSLESCLLAGESDNFSEDNLALKSGYFASNANAATLYNTGGNSSMSTAYVVRWGGPVNESEDAYGDSATPAGLSARKHVQDVIWLPGRGSSTDNSGLKTAILQYGAADVSMYFAGSSSGSSYYSAANAAYYYGGSTSGANHDVTVVGWDDTYSASNFATKPSGNGAFIVKNSWGTSWGKAGYFYVSYYDRDFGYDEMAVFDNAESATNYGDVYQYDPLGCTATTYYATSTATTGTGWFANVFTARSSASTTVTAVGFYTAYPNTAYSIYTGSSLAGKTLNTSGTQAYMGYHTITLATPINIAAGQSFAIAVKVVTGNTVTGTVYYPIAMEYPISGYSDQAAASSGQSYFSLTGTSWTDITTDSTLLRSGSGFAGTNVCLKAYSAGSGSSNNGYTLTTSVASGSGSITCHPNKATYNAGDVVTLAAVPSDGCAFSNWGGALSGSTNAATITITGNTSVSATFTAVSMPTRYEQTNSLLVYAGSWSTGSGTTYSGRSYKYTNSATAKVTAYFTGTSVALIGATGPSNGIAKVTLDGVTYYPDFYSKSLTTQQSVWSVSLLPGSHTLVIQRNGTKNAASKGYTINIDALDILGGALTSATKGTNG